jgi:hypothetical protein
MAETPQQPSTCRAGRRQVEQTLMHEIREPHTSGVRPQPQLPAHPQPAGEALSFCYKSFHSSPSRSRLRSCTRPSGDGGRVYFMWKVSTS